MFVNRDEACNSIYSWMIENQLLSFWAVESSELRSPLNDEKLRKLLVEMEEDASQLAYLPGVDNLMKKVNVKFITKSLNVSGLLFISMFKDEDIEVNCEEIASRGKAFESLLNIIDSGVAHVGDTQMRFKYEGDLTPNGIGPVSK